MRQPLKELGGELGTVKQVAEQLGIGTESLRGWDRRLEMTTDRGIGRR